MNLQIFKNVEFGEVQTVQRNNETYFVGKDVADALGYGYALIFGSKLESAKTIQALGNIRSTPFYT